LSRDFSKEMFMKSNQRLLDREPGREDVCPSHAAVSRFLPGTGWLRGSLLAGATSLALLSPNLMAEAQPVSPAAAQPAAAKAPQAPVPVRVVCLAEKEESFLILLCQISPRPNGRCWVGM
jgi:hypothetical protein